MAEELHPDEFAQAAAAAIADTAGRDARATAKVLADAGLIGVCAAEAAGGLALDIAFALPVAVAAGRAHLAFPLLEQMLLAKALGEGECASQLVSGERLATWALQGSLGDGLAGPARGAVGADWVLVADEQGGALCAMDTGAVQQDLALDPESPQDWLDPTGLQVRARLDAQTMSRLRRELDLLVAGYVNGIASAALARTAEHTATRVQFGKPLAAHQAVRHALARMCLATQAVDASVHRLLSVDEFGYVRDSLPVVAHAIAQSAWVLEQAIQLHGGMGFTWALPLHRGLREIRKWDAAYGAGAVELRCGRHFIDAA